MAFDFSHAVSSPFRMQPGLRRLDTAQPQLTPNRSGARHLREKLAVLLNWPEEALLKVPGFDPQPALRALMTQALTEHPDAFEQEAGGALHARWLGWAVGPSGELAPRSQTLPELGDCLRKLPAEWRLAALLALALQEDLAIVDGATATLPWLAVALPSHWAPRDKIGRHFAEVHAPVADNRLLLTAGAHLMRLATGAERWERFVWNITPHPRLNHHPARTDPTGWPAAHEPEALVDLSWFRTERQTFIPLPEYTQAVFTIQVDSQPLRQAIQSADQARQLHDAVATMSDAVLAYRSLTLARPGLLAWLAQRASC